MDPKERDGPRKNGQALVTRWTIIGNIPIGTAERMVFEVDPWAAVELVPYHCAVSLNSSRVESNTHTPTLRSLGVQRILLM